MPQMSISQELPTTSPSVVSVLAALQPLLDADTTDPDPLCGVLGVVSDAAPGVAGATLCRRRPGRTQLRTAAATDPAYADVDAAQFRVGRGPLVDAISRQTAVSTTDVTSDPRWPTLAERLSGSAPMAAVSVPVHEASRHVCILTLYSREPLDPVQHAQIPLLVGLLEVALTALAQHERVRNLRHATLSNRRIGIAVGVLMAYNRTTAEQAFEVLAAASQVLNRKVVDLAEDVILSGALPEMPEPGRGLPEPRPATP